MERRSINALAVFHNHGNHVLDPLLKAGFRHVFVALQNGDYWIRVDGMSGVPVVEVVAPADFDLATFYLAEGFTVNETKVDNKCPTSPFVSANCVGLSKGFLGIRKPLILTPYALHRYLRNAK